MPIQFDCRRCRATLEAPDDLPDNRTRCPHCDAINVVPDVGLAVGDDEDVPVVEPVRDRPASPRERAWREPGQWQAFASGCLVVKWGVVIELLALAALFVLIEVVVLDRLFGWALVPKGKGIGYAVLLLYLVPLLIAAGVLGVGRTIMLRLPADTGAAGVLIGAAGLAWLRFIALLTAVSFAVLALGDDVRAAQVYYTTCAQSFFVAMFAGTVAEISAIPGMAVVGGAMPSRLLRARAGRLAFALQLCGIAWVLLAAVSMYSELLADALAPLRPAPAPAPNRPGVNPAPVARPGAPMEIAVVVTAVILVLFAIQAVFAYLQHALYATGQGAGRTDGDRFA